MKAAFFFNVAISFAFLGDGVAAQTVETADQGIKWAESLSDIKTWNGEWHDWRGYDIYRPAKAVVSNGVVYIINRNDGPNRKAIDNIRFVRSYRHSQFLIHEYSVTCHPQFGNRPSDGTLKVFVSFFGPYGNNRVDGTPQMDGCGLNMKRDEKRVFSPPPYPPLR
jgi:hypothetical protein